MPEGHRISIRLADAAGPRPKCMGTAPDDAYPAANETWLYCTRPPAVTWIRAPIPSGLLVFPSSFRSNQCAAPGLSFNHNSAGALKVVVTTFRRPSQFGSQLTSSVASSTSVIQASALQRLLSLGRPRLPRKVG